MARERSKHVEVRLRAGASSRERRELEAFVRFCVARLERDLARIDRWIVTIVPDLGGGFACTAIAHRLDQAVEAQGLGRDGTLAAWTALGNLEQALREGPAG